MIKWQLLAPAAVPTSAITNTRLFSYRSIFTNLIILIIGLLIGSQLTYTWLSNNTSNSPQYFINNRNLPLQYKINNRTLLENTSAQLNSHQENFKSTLNTDTVIEDTVADLYNSTRVLCWIMTNPTNHMVKAIHIRRTWGQRCNKLLFMSSQADEQLNSIELNVTEGRDHLWDKTQSALKYIYDHHLNDAEWFLKADDDTYVIMENLRAFLYRYPPEAPIYFGCKFGRYIRQGYMSGGAGYVLSKTALIKFATEAFNNTKNCKQAYMAEDTQLGLCLQNVGVLAGDSRDDESKERFIPLSPEYIIPEDRSWWYKQFVYHRPNENVTCCSPTAISFHYIPPNQFYIMDYLLYTLRPFGINGKSLLSSKINISDVYSEVLEYFYPLPSPPGFWEEDDVSSTTTTTQPTTTTTATESEEQDEI